VRVPTPLRSFRVYPERRSLYWEVRFYRDVPTMRLAYGFYRGKVSSKVSDGTARNFVRAEKALAITAATTFVNFRHGRQRTSPVLGRLFFAFGSCGAMILSHEAAHATRYYLIRMGVKLDDPETDERFARILGDIVRDIAKEIW